MNQEMINRNIWHTDTKDLFDAVLECLSGKWRWSRTKNMNCKYITIRIDMRDGGYLLYDDSGKRIDTEELKYQEPS